MVKIGFFGWFGTVIGGLGAVSIAHTLATYQPEYGLSFQLGRLTFGAIVICIGLVAACIPKVWFYLNR